MRELLMGSIAAGLMLAALGAQAGDAAAGKSKAMKCISCHGLKGIANNPQYPNLAGQKEAYLIAQMEAFKSGTRSLASKTVLFGGLSATDFADLADHFTSLPAGSAGSKADTTTLEKGKAAYEEACANCHGGNGEGSNEGPQLAGQNAAYTVKRMGDYRNGGGSSNGMKKAANNASDEDIATVSEYLSSLK